MVSETNEESDSEKGGFYTVEDDESPAGSFDGMQETYAQSSSSPNINDTDSPSDSDRQGAISWTAPEFINQGKSPGWYALLVLAALIITALTYLLTKDWVPTSAVLLAVGLLVFYSSHKPREVTYAVTASDIRIGTRRFNIKDFRSYSVQREMNLVGIELMPLRRLAMLVTVYCRNENVNQVTNLLSKHLPLAEPKNGLVETIMRQIHF